VQVLSQSTQQQCKHCTGLYLVGAFPDCHWRAVAFRRTLALLVLCEFVLAGLRCCIVFRAVRQILITEKRRPFFHFITNLCAIIGGVFTVSVDECGGVWMSVEECG